MRFFQKFKMKLKLKKEYKTVFCPFFNNLKQNLRELKQIDTNIPDDISNVYEKIKLIDNKKFKKATEKYDSFYVTVGKHNSDVVRLTGEITEFDKEKILENALIYDHSKIITYYQIEKELDNYINLSEDIISFKNEAILIYDNFEIIKQQKMLFEDKKTVFGEISSSNEYLDYNYVDFLIEKDNQINEQLKEYKILFYDFDAYRNIKEFIEDCKKEFLIKNKNNSLFDNINNRSLDDEQRESVLTDELSTLVVAGAGSGKTLTICGKVKYLLKEKKIEPEEILLISYSKKSADDLQLKVSSIDKRLMVGTFHKIGLSILKEIHNKIFMVEDQYEAIIEKYFRDEIKNKTYMFQTILTYYGLYISSNKRDKKYENEGELFENLKKKQFLTLKSKLRDNNKLKTLKKEYVKSFEEMAIANWYFINGIDYVYEAPYAYDVSTKDKRQYMPDFYLPKYNLYHEHYGVNKDGNAEQYNGPEAQAYVDSMKWKRNTHIQNQTDCLETYSYEFDDGSIFEKLEKVLKEKGVVFNPLPNTDIFNALESIYEDLAFKSFIDLTRTFLSLYKARYRDESEFDKLMNFDFKNAYERKRAKLFLTIAKDVYLYYMEYLRKEGKIDFDDMILKSIEELDKTNNFKYRYVIVDEFQDISLSRMLFLKKLISHGHSKLFAVGDDWQSIYRFSGCDLNIFLHFQNYFGVSAITKINTIHRNSQELQDVAGSFIKKNPEQFDKRINSCKHLEHPIKIMYYSDKKYNAFLDILKEISKLDNKANVLILGRNNKDFESISLDNRIYISFKKSKETNTEVKVRDYPDMKLSYSTVHGSKGLEADYVIIINADDSILGFPSKMEDDELLNLVLDSNSNYEYAEERRLWYVALTRTKNYTYIIANSENPSIFVKEIKDQCLIMNPNMEATCENNIPCPYCKSGHLVLRTNKTDGNKFYGCSNYPYCDYSINDIRAVTRNKKCKICGDFLVYRKGTWGAFYGCHNYPRCDYKEKYVSDKK